MERRVKWYEFQSTPLSLAETLYTVAALAAFVISIHSAIASGDSNMTLKLPEDIISIHSAIASGDSDVPGRGEEAGHFNPLRYR